MQKIEAWLISLGLSEYADRFAKNDIDIDVLPELTDQHLKDLGISLGHRLKLRRAIGELRPNHSPAALETLIATHAQQNLSAERRQLTVMFCDIVGSTALSAQLDPEDMREIIGAYRRVCTEVITKFDGFIAQYLGDGVLAYFGHPEAHEDDPERAVRAGLALIKALDDLRGTTLRARVGIASGLVVVGDLAGDRAAQEHGIVGETPNLAARLQALADPNDVVISDSTRRATAGLFVYRDLGRVSLKGLPRPVQCWRVLGVGPTRSRFEAQHETGLTPLVGRQEELELLLCRWREAKQGQGQVVLISGEPGIGKSRLVVALEDRLRGEPPSRLRYFCSPRHADSPFYPHNRPA